MEQDKYLTAVEVRERFGGRSDSWLWRILQRDKSFPRPLRIGKRRYWQISKLQAWEESQMEPIG